MKKLVLLLLLLTGCDSSEDLDTKKYSITCYVQGVAHTTEFTLRDWRLGNVYRSANGTKVFGTTYSTGVECVTKPL